MNQHQATQVAPSSLLQSFDEDLVSRIESRHRGVSELLESVLGKPYFSDTGFFLYQGNCAEFLERLRTSGIGADLALTSPPYNIGKEYEERISVDEYVDWCVDWIQKIHDVTSPTATFWLNVGYLEIPNKGLCVPIPYLLWDQSSFYLLQEIVWAYGAGVSAKRRFSPRNEKWLFYVKDPERFTFNLDDIRDPNVKYPNQKKNGKFRCNPLGKNPSDVWEFPKVTTGTDRSSKERTGHPAQFPLAVVERVIRGSSDPVDLVLDPFAGSCSAGIAAVGLGRLFIGFELRSDYCQLAVERFKKFKSERDNAQRQQKLFSNVPIEL